VAGDVWTLQVFQRACRLSLALHRASLGWPRVEQQGGVAEQLRRASKSVCALLVEGAGLCNDGDRFGRRGKTVVSLCRRSRVCPGNGGRGVAA
jgi:hypothetical protein